RLAGLYWLGFEIRLPALRVRFLVVSWRSSVRATRGRRKEAENGCVASAASLRSRQRWNLGQTRRTTHPDRANRTLRRAVLTLGEGYARARRRICNMYAC